MRNIVNFLMVFVAFFIVACGDDKEMETYKTSYDKRVRALAECKKDNGTNPSEWSGKCAKIWKIDQEKNSTPEFSKEKYEAAMQQAREQMKEFDEQQAKK